jgi:hypothetical protein
MASSYSTDLKLELMVTGENAGTWGDKTNTNLNLIQQAIAGVQSIDVGPANVTLVMSNASLSNARNAVLVLTGTLTDNREVLVPNGIEKNYIIIDNTSRAGFSLTVKTVSGTGFAISTSGTTLAAYSDGINLNEVSLTTLSGTVSTAQISALSVTSAKLNSFAVTAARINSLAVTTSRLATNAVTGVKITQSTITQSKLAANSVGANQLISTGVTAASYTAANITVDADGRISTASSGSAGAGMEIPTLFAVGPASGTYTAGPSTTEILAYSYGGGPAGGFGAYVVNVVAPYSQPYSVGASGSATRLGPAPAPVFITNGGPAGTAPGASFTYPARSFVVGENFGSNPTQGALIIFENSGT